MYDSLLLAVMVAFNVLPELVVLLYEVCGMVSLASSCVMLVVGNLHRVLCSRL